MKSFYDDTPHWPERAQQIWIILVGKAANMQLTTYKEIRDILGFKGSYVLGKPLGHIACYCNQNGLPGLTTIVVNEEGGVPGEGIPVSGIESVRMKVYKYKWYKLVPPSPEQLKEAWDNPDCEK